MEPIEQIDVSGKQIVDLSCLLRIVRTNKVVRKELLNEFEKRDLDGLEDLERALSRLTHPFGAHPNNYEIRQLP